MNPRIVAISGPLKGSKFPLGPFDLLIGKGRSCHVRLDDPLVSAKHCGIAHEGEHPVMWDTSGTGTFVNGFHFPGKFLFHGDRIRVGHSIFIYLDRTDEDVDNAMLIKTVAEEEWDRKIESNQSGLRAAAYEPAITTILDALLEFNNKINATRDTDAIHSHVFEMIFRVMPVEGVAILVADPAGDGILSATYRRIGLQNGEPFPLDDNVTQKAMSQDGPVYGDKAVCVPLVAAGTKVGFIYAVMAADGFEWFTAGHMRLLIAIAGSTAVALEHARYVSWLEGENRLLKEAINAEHEMIGRSEKMQRVYQRVTRAAGSEVTVLITGESGTGKELVAKALHRNSPRSQNAMYFVNCAAFTDALLGSELFGHEKGAFTGADKQRQGLFEFANGGTVFLDEIGECSLTLQADLLRLIQQKEFKRLGSNQILHANVRLIAATNVDLEKAVKEGRFRRDLYFRLDKIRIEMPRLADRRDDIQLLVAEFIKKHGHIRTGPYPRVQGVTPEVRQIFLSYDWPGNVRELENVIESAIALGASAYIGTEDLPASLTGATPKPAELGDWVTELNASKRRIVEKALQMTSGHRAEAGRRLKLNPKYFSALCKELNIKPA
jgi:transcriptional regulator with GAF, ATPase, and Fis domain